MKENNIKKIGSLIVIIILIIMLILVILCTSASILYKLNIKNDIIRILSIHTTYESPNDIIEINWKEKYPIDDANNQIANKKNVFQKINEKFNLIKEKIENKTAEGILGYEKFIEISYFYDKTIAYTLKNNNDVDSRIQVGDYFCKLELQPNAQYNIDKKAKQIEEFAQELSQKNIGYIYVQAPHKIEKNNNYISKIYKNSVNDNVDELLNKLKEKIDYLDLREQITATGWNYLDMFFKTDHHWKPETGIWATGEIIDKLNKDYNFNIDKDLICNMDNYNKQVLHTFLGSDGRNVTLANAKLEDISIITPKYKTNFNVNIPDKKFSKTGLFEDTLLNKEKMKFINPYNSIHYAIYLHENRPLVEIHNENNKDGKKILFINDSFAHVVIPYISLGVEYVSKIDLRVFDGSIKAYIEEYKPDVVITLLYPGCISIEEMWNYQ